MSATPPEKALPLRLILVLALLSATGPIATDIYLASFPEISHGLRTDAPHVQLTLTAFLLGIGVGQLLWGPLSDRVGRWRPMVVGSAIATVASVVVMFSPNVEVMIGARFVQAVCAAATMVLARAVISDLSRGFAAAHSISLMMAVQAIAPIAAPVVGGLLSGHVPWRGVLGVVTLCMAAQLVGAVTVVRETLPASRRTATLSYRPLGVVLRRPAFVLQALTQALSMGAIMSFISSSSFIYQGVLGLPGWVFGLGFALNSAGVFWAGTRSAARARARIHPARTISLALPVAATAALLVLGAAASPHPILLLVPLWVVIASLGFVTGNAVSLAMEQVRDRAGAGSAVVGGLMFLTMSLCSVLSGLGGEDTAVPMALTTLGAVLLCATVFVVARRVVEPGSEAAFVS
ncbi:Bcr/CflA family efflux MFS transporter [Nocardioides sp. Kera G14]|uniref:Bcr/CflA family efflux MFS transporter n=1 Tax=Nocardioides sp. Kera G14 TaxID=2884264 RepID=UPI001D11BDD9|nr:Bcr/CflA family efflux MFS transporter [Nocardioides sp. Kera G14]UDY23440.1 Bcr/CflA family efflux MFS transporter [Nocardioides sp. Kera G14]